VQHSGHQAGGPCSEVSPSVILLPAPITNSGTTKPECHGLSQFNEDLLYLNENLISRHAR